MSTGGFFGGIVGGVIGFFVGGPWGAAVGASFGMGIGMMIDPLQPDTQSPGQPQMAEFTVPSSDEGIPLPDLVGMTKCTGNIIWHGGDRAKAIYTTTTTEGGKSSSDTTTTQQTGWKYYASFAIGICQGPVDKLYTVFNGEDAIWNGEITRTDLNANGETIILTDMGPMTFYWGTSTQTANSDMTSMLSEPTLNPAYRNQCYAYFNDVKIGENSNRIPDLKFIIGKFPAMAWTDKERIGIYDYNPAAAVYYSLVSMAELPDSYVNETTFSGAAHTLWQEGLGISCFYNSYNSTDTYVSSILNHTVSIVRYSHDGTFDMQLLRKDVPLYDMQEVDEAIYLDKPIIRRISWIDTLNEIKLSYVLRSFVNECVIGPPTLTLVGQTSSDDCEGEAEYSVYLGCEPFTLQKSSGGSSWIDVMMVGDTFTWLHTPSACLQDAVSIRIKDNEGQGSNVLVLGNSCTCGSAVIESSMEEMTCSQTAHITLSGSIDTDCCVYSMEIFSGGGTIEEGLTQTGPATWTLTSPGGAGTGGACCLDDSAQLKLYCCAALIDTIDIPMTGGPPLVYFPDNPSIVEYNNSYVIDVGWGTPPFHWKPPVQDQVFNWRYTDTWERYNWIEVGEGAGDCGVSTQLICTDACENTAWGTITVPASPSDLEYDDPYSANSVPRNSSRWVGVTDTSNEIYTWTIVGDGFWMTSARNTKTLITTDKHVKVWTDGTACGIGNITITSCDGDNETEGAIRCTTGTWFACDPAYVVTDGHPYYPMSICSTSAADKWNYTQGYKYAPNTTIRSSITATGQLFSKCSQGNNPTADCGPMGVVSLSWVYSFDTLLAEYPKKAIWLSYWKCV